MKPSCRRCRSDLAARDAGSLAPLAQAWVDSHLAGCKACREFRSRLSAAIDAGRAWRPAPTPEERDALYEALPRMAPARKQRRVARAIVLAAGMVAAAIAALAIPRRVAPPPPAPIAATPPPVAPPAVAVAPDAVPRAEAIEYRRYQPAPGLELLVAAGSSWRATTEGTRWRLVLEQGSLYARFRGRPGVTLVAEAPGIAVKVAGTVFKLSAAGGEAEVAVLEGRVTVQAAAGAAAPLMAGQVRLPSGAVQAADPAEGAPAEWLSAPPRRPSRSPVVEPPAPPPAPEPPTPEAMYADAEGALRTGDVAAAARALEALLAVHPGTPQSVTARLELARLYLGPLDRRERAVDLLRSVIADAPSEAETAAARRLLCRALGPPCPDAP